jgi:enoyl-CoA hydratase/carnithine racemase
MTTTTQQSALRFEVNETGIATLWLDAEGKSVVILDRSGIQRLNTTLDLIEKQTEITGLILRSDCERVFVAGADLKEIDGLNDQGLHAYLAFGTTVFGRIAALPYPTVACLNGATLGGGLEIAMHCDGLVASKHTSGGKGYSIGLPEAKLGLCPGWGGTQMLPARIDPETAMIATATGTLFDSTDLPDGLVDVLVDTPDDLQEAAETWLQSATASTGTPTAINPADGETYCTALETAKANTDETEAAQGVFHAIEIGITSGWTAAVAVEQCELVRLRNTSTAREKLDAFLSKE